MDIVLLYYLQVYNSTELSIHKQLRPWPSAGGTVFVESYGKYSYFIPILFIALLMFLKKRETVLIRILPDFLLIYGAFCFGCVALFWEFSKLPGAVMMGTQN